MRKKRKLYVAIALLAVVGLILTSLTGLFSGLLAGSDPAPGDPVEDSLRMYERVAASLEKELKGSPDDAEKMEQLADIYFEMGSLYDYLQDPASSLLYFTKSLASYQNALKTIEDDNDLILKMSISAYYSGDFAVAEAGYKDVIARDPEHPGPYFYYGFLLFRDGNLDGAAEKWETLLELEESFDPEKYPGFDASIFANAASFLEQVRPLEEAEEEEEAEADAEGESTP